jgi:NADH:ubiquinone oxidoreductase subunit E
MSVATSAVERLQDVAGRAGAITEADERVTATELNVPVAAVHGAATFYDDLAQPARPCLRGHRMLRRRRWQAHQAG